MVLVTPTAASQTLFARSHRRRTSWLPAIVARARRFFATQVLHIANALHESRQRQARLTLMRYRHLIESEQRKRDAGNSRKKNSPRA